VTIPRVAYWFVGTAIALVGVAIVRLVSPNVPDDLRVYSTSIGVTIAVVGILAAALGAGKNARGGRAPPVKPNQNEQ